MRLFVGIDLSEQVHRRVLSYLENIKREFPLARWVRPESLHITLKFIGETQKFDEVSKALGLIRAAPIDIEFRGTGFFTPRSPRVFFIGVHPGDELFRLQEQVDVQLQQIGIPREDKPYQPHLTLARTGSGKPSGSPKDRNAPKMWPLRDKIAAGPELEFGRMTAQEFILYQSRLGPGGAQYDRLKRFPLG